MSASGDRGFSMCVLGWGGVSESPYTHKSTSFSHQRAEGARMAKEKLKGRRWSPGRGREVELGLWRLSTRSRLYQTP